MASGSGVEQVSEPLLTSRLRGALGRIDLRWCETCEGLARRLPCVSGVASLSSWFIFLPRRPRGKVRAEERAHSCTPCRACK